MTRSQSVFEETRVIVKIVEYGSTAEEDVGVAALLMRVYVEGGFTDALVAATAFAPSEVRRRGDMLLARTAT
ncbi:MAG TPA: hypothetical protein VK660_02290, partial [Xanthomonadaceae bacterium]|nr:hypothetical protein [Xanthomonadaceae bacterium]